MMWLIKGAMAFFGFSPFSLLLYAGLAVAAAGVVGGIWKSGANYSARKCEAAALRAELRATRTDLQAANAAAAAANAARAESEIAAQQSNTRIAEYEDELKKRPNGACALTDDDVRRLRGPDAGKATGKANPPGGLLGRFRPGSKARDPQ